MQQLSTFLRTFIKEEDGAAIAEYGLLLGILAVGMVTILIAFRREIGRIWSGILSSMADVETP